MEPGAGEPAVLLEDVSRRFDGGRVCALDHVTLTLAGGESVCVVGRSGSGKTTLVSTIAGLAPPDSGRVMVCGRSPASVAAWARLRRERIGIVLQEPHLIPTLTAVENVEIAMFGDGRSGKQRRVAALSLLDAVGLDRQSGQNATTLSGGEKQRVAIARALANSPDLLLADEPTGNLDRTTAAEVADLLFALRDRHRQTLIVVTHDQDLAARFDRLFEMDDGRLREVADPPSAARPVAG